MGVSNLYSLPYLGMKDGFHEYHFKVESQFFMDFENSPIQKGDFDINLSVDKSGNISKFDFYITGFFEAICDRCLAEIRIPVSGNFKMHGKMGNEDEADDDVIYINPDQSNIDMSFYFYEMICLTLPLINVYNCNNEVPRVCDDTVLSKLSIDKKSPNVKTDNKNVWDSLQGLLSDN
ncbi:MAG: DUF177 domain-containing protein [Saprospiraceae bacterium]|nr:DUF177 domain-containing protein [Saprospiraceae bacterium]